MSTIVFPLFLFFFLEVAAFCFSCFWLLFLVSFFLGALCFLSLSFHRLNKPFEIDSELFLAVSLIVSLIHVDPVRNHAMNNMY